MLPTWMYSKGPQDVYVNLFAGSTVKVEGVAGTDVEMVQTTDYPWKGTVAIGVNPAKPASFAVRIRMPNRDVSSLYASAPESNGIDHVSVNGAAVKPNVENGYAVITRRWKTGDKIELTLPMRIQRVHASDRIAATNDRVALRYGPLVYNIEKVDQDITGVLAPAAQLTAEWQPDLLGGVVAIKSTFANGSAMTAIPNYARYNRNPPAPPYVPPPQPARGAAAPGTPPPQRPAPPPPESIVWISEG
jgi:DUF1680 family protein